MSNNEKEAVGVLFLTINAPFGIMKYFLTKQSGEFQIAFNDSKSENAKKEGFLVTKAEAEEHFPNFDWVDFNDLKKAK